MFEREEGCESERTGMCKDGMNGHDQAEIPLQEFYGIGKTRYSGLNISEI